jgi:hypothetical protein
VLGSNGRDEAGVKMSNVVALDGGRVPQTGEPNEALIHVLEDALVMARTGKLQSFIGTGFLAEGGRVALWAGDHPNVYEMLGSIAWLEHEYVDRISSNIKK